jgi:D-glycero-D-manno-heptose 1,7-bisphosphate phosphatase
MRRAVFIDRDGVICHNRNDHVKSWEEFVFLPGAVEAMVWLTHLDLPIVVITNQAVINRGIVPEEVVEDINHRMVLAIEAAGGRIDKVIYCPHRPDEHCACRKPQPGMLLNAARDLGLDLFHSYLIGDAETDMQAGQAVGCHCYMVLTGRGAQQLVLSLIRGRLSFAVKWNLGAAVDAILRRENRPEWEHPRYVLGGGGGR